MSRSFKSMTDAELAELVVAANKVQEMVSTPGYREIVAPRIEAAKKKADDAARWTPGKTTDLSAIGLTSIFKDGRISGLDEIAAILQDVLADKAEAIKVIHQRKEKAGGK